MNKRAMKQDTQIPYDAQCPHGWYYDDCSICSGAQADFERACYLLAEELPDDWLGTSMHPVDAPTDISSAP